MTRNCYNMMQKYASLEEDQLDALHAGLAVMSPLAIGAGLTKRNQWLGRAGGGMAGISLGYAARKIARTLGASNRTQNSLYLGVGIPSSILLGALGNALSDDRL